VIPIIAGAMALAVLDAVVSHNQAASNVGGWFQTFGNAVRRFLSPAVPAFTTGTSTPGPSKTAAISTVPPALAPAGVGTPTTTSPPVTGVLE
jgi:hypothetical protein